MNSRGSKLSDTLTFPTSRELQKDPDASPSSIDPFSPASSHLHKNAKRIKVSITSKPKGGKPANPSARTGKSKHVSPSKKALKGLKFDRFLGLRTTKVARQEATGRELKKASAGKIKKAVKTRKKAMELANKKALQTAESATTSPAKTTKTPPVDNKRDPKGHFLPGIFFPILGNPAIFSAPKENTRKKKKRSVEPICGHGQGSRIPGSG